MSDETLKMETLLRVGGPAFIQINKTTGFLKLDSDYEYFVDISEKKGPDDWILKCKKEQVVVDSARWDIQDSIDSFIKMYRSSLLEILDKTIDWGRLA